MSVGMSRSSIENDVKRKLFTFGSNLSENDINAISFAISDAIDKNNQELDHEIRKLKNLIHSIKIR